MKFTAQEIAAMAHEAAPDLTWFAAVEDPREAAREEIAFLTRFAALVAGKAATQEREACAQVCDERQTPGTGSVAILGGAADAIRERGQKGGAWHQRKR